MEITVSRKDDVSIMDLKGDLSASSAERLKEESTGLAKNDSVRIILDMSKVTFIDSSGLSACVEIHTMLRDRNGLMVCAKLSEAAKKIFRITGADKKMTVVGSCEEGLALFKASG